MNSFNSRRSAFTLIEIVVVLVVVGALTALIFPAFARARQGGQQTKCASNLQQIYVAVRQYREDAGHYPSSLESLLPAGSKMIVTSGGDGVFVKPTPTTAPDSFSGHHNDTDDFGTTSASTTKIVATGGVGLLPTRDVVVCPSDTEETNAFSASYGVKTHSIWNFRGYATDGFELSVEPPAAMRLYPANSFNITTNPAKYSLANRFAPPSTIITHCIYHRKWTSKLSDPYALGTATDGGKGIGASDIILRLDGSVKLTDISGFAGPGGTPSNNRWQIQTP